MVAVLMPVAATAFLRGQSGSLSSTFTNWIDHPTIAYRSAPASDPVSQLNQALQNGRNQLRADGASEYLRSLLEALDVPVELHFVVFARDSVQLARITMANPRALLTTRSRSAGSRPVFIRSGISGSSERRDRPRRRSAAAASRANWRFGKLTCAT